MRDCPVVFYTIYLFICSFFENLEKEDFYVVESCLCHQKWRNGSGATGVLDTNQAESTAGNPTKNLIWFMQAANLYIAVE